MNTAMATLEPPVYVKGTQDIVDCSVISGVIG